MQAETEEPEPEPEAKTGNNTENKRVLAAYEEINRREAELVELQQKLKLDKEVGEKYQERI